MDARKKNIVYTLVLLSLIAVVFFIRRQQSNTNEEKAGQNLVQFKGRTMGTFYSVKYIDVSGRHFKSEIDSLLEQFNLSLSTYISGSEISRFNRGSVFEFSLPFFYTVLETSREVYIKTKGAFDPTVMPLVNAWGFGPEGPQFPEDQRVEELLKRVGFDKIDFDKKEVRKQADSIQLDFSAIAKGYGVDIVAHFLTLQGIENYMVEIGGEVNASGKNDAGQWWRIGIEQPEEGAPQKRAAIFELENRSIATSGNYKNFYVKDGKKYAHTLNPETGYPVTHNLLSATVFAPSCMLADAYATAFMVMGLEQTKAFVTQEEGIDVFLIFAGDDGELQTYTSPDITNYRLQ